MKISSRLASWLGGWRSTIAIAVIMLASWASATHAADIRVFGWEITGPVNEVVAYWSADNHQTWTECGRGAEEFVCTGTPDTGKFDLRLCALRTDGVEICWERAGQWYDLDAQPIQFRSFKTQRVHQ